MKNSTLNYVLKRVLVFLVISVIIMLFNACEVHAESYQVETKPVTFYLATTQSSGTLSGNTDTLITASNYQAYYRFLLPFNTTTDTTANVLFIGQYLVELYVYSNKGIRNSLECYQLSSDFQNVNMTSGNWVNNEINSQCLDIYKTTYNGIPAYRILYKFTYKGGAYNTDAISEIRIDLNSSPNDFFADSTNLDVIGVSMSNIYDYDPDMISQFALEKSNQISIEQSQTIINQNQEIINGQTDIINNQNQNTQDIIDNQNSNTDREIESQKVCENYNYNKDNTPISRDNYYLTSGGGNQSSSSYMISEYIPINKQNNYNLITSWGNSSLVVNYCIYDENKTLKSCSKINTTDITINSNENGYIRYSISKSSGRTTNFTGKYCKNGNQALVDSLTDDSTPNLDALNNSAGWLPPGPVDSILNLPIALLNNLTTNLSKHCQPVILPIPYVDQNITLPCVYSLYEQMGITTWVGLIGTIASALILFSYLAKLYKWVDDTLTFRENNSIDNWGGI